MKQRNTLTLILLFAALSLAAQNYSPCYTNNMSKGNTAFNQGKYSEAKTYYATAKQCAGGNPTEAQKKIAACDAKLKAQKEAAEAKKKAEEERVAEERRQAEEQRQKAEEEAAIKARGFQNFTVNGVTFKMIYVQGGTFTMGCNLEDVMRCAVDENPEHQVTVGDFWICETEVTVGLFKAFVNETGYRTEAEKAGRATRWMQDEYGYWNWIDKGGVNWKDDVNGNVRNSSEDCHPVIYVSWNDANAFCEWLMQKTGKVFRLPTEAEWEYAALGGNKSKGYKYCGSNTLGDVAWYDGNANGKTHPVKTKSPNELGLYDMFGNAEEWCQDWWSMDYYENSPSNDPQGPSSGSLRISRGNYYGTQSKYFRVGKRGFGNPDKSYNTTGFRFVLIQ